MSGAGRFVLEYLLNSLWQVPLLYGAAWVASRMLRRAGPRMEHRVWVGALLLEAVLPACGLATVGAWAAQVWRLARTAGAVGRERITVTMTDGVVRGGLRLPSSVLQSVVLLYGAGCGFLLLRLLWQSYRLRELRRESAPVVLGDEAGRSWARCVARFEIGAVELRVSETICGPVTLGVWRRLVLLPRSLAGTLAAREIEAALAHECAHVARRDFAKNLLYEFASLLVRYHPVFWLTRERVIETREVVCDAMAAEAAGGRKEYARALIRLAAVVVGPAPARTFHAIGIFDANVFERRLMKLTGAIEEIKGVRRVAMLAGCLVLVTATCGSALALRMSVAGSEAQGAAVTRTATGLTMSLKVPSKVMAEQSLTKVNPEYPKAAREAKIEGAVVLRAEIDKEGKVEKLQVVSGPKELQRSALDAVRQWVYKPYLLNGDAVAVETTITVNYALEK